MSFTILIAIIQYIEDHNLSFIKKIKKYNKMKRQIGSSIDFTFQPA